MDSKNFFLISDDGILIAFTSLGKMAIRGELIIPWVVGGIKVTSIGDCAFMNNNSITSVIIPEGITEIREGAFSHCTSLTEVILPSTIKRIEVEAFGYCPNIEIVKYNGTEEQWNDVYIGTCNMLLRNCKLICKCETDDVHSIDTDDSKPDIIIPDDPSKYIKSNPKIKNYIKTFRINTPLGESDIDTLVNSWIDEMYDKYENFKIIDTNISTLVDKTRISTPLVTTIILTYQK